MTKLIRYQCSIRIVMFMLSAVATSAQPFVDPLNVKYQNFSQVPYSDNETNKLSSSLYEATILLPIELENKDVVLINADLTKMNFNTTSENVIHTNLYSTSLSFGYDHGWKNSKWRTMGMLIPKINSDFKNTSDAFQMGGVILANYKKNDNLKYHFGVYYNQEFFGDYLIPLLGIEWKINDRMNLFGDLPSNLNFEYKINKKLYAGAAFQSVISTYRLSNGDYVREGDNALGHDQLKLYVNVYLTPHIVAYAEAGETFYRMYNLYDTNNHAIETNPVFHKSNDGFFYTTGLAYRIRLD